MTPTDASTIQLTLSGRELALMRRQALALHGKAGTAQTTASQPAGSRPAMATYRTAAAPLAAPASAPTSAQPTTGRQVAMQRRLARSLVGCGDDPAEVLRPSGRMRTKHEAAPAPAKVAQGHTLSGRPVTGTSLDNTLKVTGNEAGSCRGITGTEYLGREQFDTRCDARPAPGPAKVGVSSTLRDQKVTGTELGRSTHVTGDEVGACRGITGTEYLAREHVEAACGSLSATPVPPTPPARKRSVMPLPATLRSTGAEVPPAQVTGTEAGGSRVTGDQKGGRRPVTGTECIGPRPLQAVGANSSPIARVARVGKDQTWRGQTITDGTARTGSNDGTDGRSSRITGDEPGRCAPISGTPYIGRSPYEAFCDAPQRAAQQALIRTEAVIPAAAVTGDRPGAGGHATTGDERGACGPVSGTPYVGRDNAPALCPPDSARFVPREQVADAAPTAPAPADFSIRPPARQAQERESHAVTGTAAGGQCITGAANKGAGLITGTPEFRHSECVPVAARQAAQQPDAPTSAARRLTGEGSQAGTRVSGDAWQHSGRVTGTEGSSSLARNPSQRGASRAMGMSAQQFRDVERAAPPDSRVTGSSGNTAKGAAVTLSGGARG